MTTDRTTAPTDSAPAYGRIALALALCAAVAAVVGDPGTASKIVVAFIAVIPFALWAFTSWTSPLVVAVSTAAATLYCTSGGELEFVMFMVSVAATIVGAYERETPALLTGAAILTAVPWVGLTFDSEAAAGMWTMGIVLPLVLSYVSERQIDLANQLAQARADLADQRVLDERRRIARDVHDSVGHGLAAMLLHITGARHVLRRDVDAADEALASAEAVGRHSMDQLRHTLGLLRTETSEGPRPPVPGIADLARRDPDGIWARFQLVGNIARIDPLVGTSLHRVAEEAFANATRHAPDARTEAVLEVRQQDVVMTIESFGHVAQCGDGDRRPRYGIVGMSERMAAVGGVLDVGPTPTGWLVKASVPLRDAESVAL